MNVPDVKAQRKKWIENINNYDKEKLVFLDESGVNTDMTRIYGRSKKGTRSVDKTPLNTPANTTILPSVRLNGETCYTTYSGGTTGKKFVDYLENMLIPTLKEGDIIVFLPNGNKYTHYYVKRVVATPGDTVLISNGDILVNGEMLEGDFDKILDAGIAENEITLAEDEFFVVGDNINSGEDSRSGNIGPVNRSLIEGRVWFKVKNGDNMTGFVKRGL